MQNLFHLIFLPDNFAREVFTELSSMLTVRSDYPFILIFEFWAL